MKLNDFINKLIELRDEGCDYIGIEDLEGDICNKISISVDDAYVVTDSYVKEDIKMSWLRNGCYEKVSKVIISNGDGLCDDDE